MDNEGLSYKNLRSSNFISIEEIKRKKQIISDNLWKYKKLPQRMKKILEYRFNVYGKNDYLLSVRATAKKLKMSPTRVVDLQREAIEILQKDWKTTNGRPYGCKNEG
jgi:DNA-directed RNA polymerase specialized sigma subunit